MKTDNLKNYGRFIGIAWIALYFTLVFQFAPQTSLPEAIIYPALVLSCLYPITTYLNKSLLPKRMKERRFGLFLIQFAVVSIISGIIYFLWSLVFFTMEKNGIFPESELFIVDNPAYYIPTFITAGLLINIIICGLRFFEETLKFQKQLYESQLYTLKAQINPHFMFNVLNHLYYYVETKDELATPLLLKYSDVLRYQLYSSKNEVVPLQEEIDFLNDFIEIEKMRWSDKLDVECNWIVEDRTKNIPPLVLITLVENAFKHVSRNADEKGFVHINMLQKGDRLVLEVANSCNGKSKQTSKDSGLGLNNMRNRLDISHYGKYTLSLYESDSVYNAKLTIEL